MADPSDETPTSTANQPSVAQSAAAAAFKSFLASEALKRAADDTADHRKQALQEQARSEAAALLSRIKSSAISTAPSLLDKPSFSGTVAAAHKDALSSTEDSTVATTTAPQKSGMDLVTYASVTKAYAAQQQQRSS